MRIVCLHGLGRSPADWDGVIAALPQRWDAQALVLPEDPDQALAAADAAISAGDVVFAHSMGAVIARRLLHARPRAVAALVLTGSFFPPARNGRSRLATTADYLAHRVAYAREALRRRPATPQDSGDARRALASLLRQATRPDDTPPQWHGASIPVLVIHARDDHHVPVDFAIAAANRHAGWTIKLFATGGHHVHVTRPVEWSAAATDWLTDAGVLANDFDE